MTLETHVTQGARRVLRGHQAPPEARVSVNVVNLFGGEPLVAESRELIHTICERCRELRVPIEVVTNGYDLDSYLDMAVEYEWGDV